MVYTTSKNGDDLGMVYGIVLTTVDTFFQRGPSQNTCLFACGFGPNPRIGECVRAYAVSCFDSEFLKQCKYIIIICTYIYIINTQVKATYIYILKCACVYI
jgi:hypothetical protein